MGKQKRQKQTAFNIPPQVQQGPRVTHEPPAPQNWPTGHVNVQLTGDHEVECMTVTIHGVKHYLHSTTAYELYKMLGTKIEEWDKWARENGAPGVIE